MKFQTLHNFIHESIIERSIYRNTAQEWLLQFLRNKKISGYKHEFISFSWDLASGGQDNYGPTRIKFEYIR